MNSSCSSDPSVVSLENEAGCGRDIFENSEEFFYLSELGTLNSNCKFSSFDEDEDELHLHGSTHSDVFNSGNTSVATNSYNENFLCERRDRSLSRMSTVSNASSMSTRSFSFGPADFDGLLFATSNSTVPCEYGGFQPISIPTSHHEKPPGFDFTPSAMLANNNNNKRTVYPPEITHTQSLHNPQHAGLMTSSAQYRPQPYHGPLLTPAGPPTGHNHPFGLTSLHPTSRPASTPIPEFSSTLMHQMSDLDLRRGLHRDLGRTPTPPLLSMQQQPTSCQPQSSQFLPPFGHQQQSSSVLSQQQHPPQRARLTSRTSSGSFDSTPRSKLGVTQDTAQLEESITRACVDILKEAQQHSLKAVELANTLRARVGTDPLALVREVWGGLLSLLENYPQVFRVERIPKNDVVCLVLQHNPSHSAAASLSRCQSTESTSSSASNGNNVLSGQLTSPQTNTLHPRGAARDNQGNEVSSRCLHVSNISAGTSEQDLQHVFGLYGDIEDITMVSQRSRRFAFVRYRSTEDACRAKQYLSTAPPFLNNISFAHHEEPNSNLGFSVGSPYRTAHKHYENSGHRGGSGQDNYGSRSRGSSFGSSLHQLHQQSSQSSNHSNNSNSWYSGGTQHGGVLTHHSQHTPPAPISSPSLSSPGAARFSKSIIAVLTDDTYVPTQSWQCKFQQDAPFLNAIITQLQILGGVATISKLRGLLKSRILSQANIKSVPLKALLGAYPKYFTLNSNLVELTPDFMFPYNHIPASNI